MKITYNAPQDTLRILFSDAPISQTSCPNSAVTLDYDQHGRLVGLELATASKQVANPYKADVVMDGISESKELPSGQDAHERESSSDLYSQAIR